MRAMTLERPAPIESNPLRRQDKPTPVPGLGEILVRVVACGVCRTDLHVCEGDLKPRHPQIVPGHEIVGIVQQCADGCSRFVPGDRVGVAWLRATDGNCRYCLSNRENLCPNALFTGWDRDGGYAEYVVV
jgi:propanol-preferring alcohol dehydrogenase